MNGAEAIIRCLEAEGVDTVFGYPGVAICPFYNSILDSSIKSILIRTEQNAAHAASGQARVTGKVGVCAVTSGPGATNLITGIATAFADSIPLVCITGQVNSELLGSDVFQEADITGAVESFVKYSYLVNNVDDIPRIMKEAFYIANTGRKGPVLIDVPIDIQQATIKKLRSFRRASDSFCRTRSDSVLHQPHRRRWHPFSRKVYARTQPDPHTSGPGFFSVPSFLYNLPESGSIPHDPH